VSKAIHKTSSVVQGVCANEDCDNPITRKPGVWLCDDCQNKMENERDRHESARDDYWMSKIDERRGK
jgi:hypothetical protein